MNLQQQYELILLALCNWREAQNQTYAAKVGQAWSVRNRAMKPSWWGHGWSGVILMSEQYDCFNPKDPNAVKLPIVGAPAWDACLAVAYDVYTGNGADPTHGATHYYDKSLDGNPPDWAKDGSMVETIAIDALRFWKHV